VIVRSVETDVRNQFETRQQKAQMTAKEEVHKLSTRRQKILDAAARDARAQARAQMAAEKANERRMVRVAKAAETWASARAIPLADATDALWAEINAMRAETGAGPDGAADLIVEAVNSLKKSKEDKLGETWRAMWKEREALLEHAVPFDTLQTGPLPTPPPPAVVTGAAAFAAQQLAETPRPGV
jgi:hypothetical protein